jgi:Uma2 family endonuclease
MHATALKSHVGYAEYLAFERDARAKHEYLDGAVYATAGGTPGHSHLAANVIYELRRLLGDRPCVVFTSDLRVRIPATGLSTYPDVSVVCGPLVRAVDDPDAVTNPSLLVEVLSDNTEAYDRGQKFLHYRRLASLREYVLVSQQEPRVEVYARGERGHWWLSEAGAGERVVLASVEGELAVDHVYRGVALAARTPPPRTAGT